MDRQVQGEIDRIVTELRSFFVSGANREDTTLTSFESEPTALERLHRYFSEVEKAIENGKTMTVLAVENLGRIFDILKGPQSLKPEDFIQLKSFLKATDDCHDRFNLGENYPLLTDLALDIKPADLLERLLDQTFSPEGEILDTASGNLAQIRRELRTISAQCSTAITRLRDRYRSHLSLPEPAIRNGRETLAVKSAEKGMVPGIVVDRSKTGETIFVLPYELLELENKRENLIGDEMAEIDKIMAHLTQSFRDHLSELERDYYSYNQLDSICGRVAFGHSYDGTVASLDPTRLVLKNFIHPLIPLDKAVANTVSLGGGDEPRILIISGPNAGGKSVMLKAIALASIMNQMGMLVPAREAILPCFDQVFILTGDSESLSGNLSSFSGHLKGLKEMYQSATGRSLVLVDEIGQGTSPEDGEALGFAFIQHILDLRAFGAFTTHYDGLKKLAAERTDILSGAMEFSQKDLRPTFHFLSGAVGNSYAFEVAEHNGISQEMIDRAKEYKKSLGKVDLESLEAQLTAKIQRNNELEQQLNDKLAEANRLIEKRDAAIKALDEQRENIRRKADNKVKDLSQRMIDELKEFWKQGQVKNLPLNERARIIGTIRTRAGLTQEEAEETCDAVTKIAVGDIVVYNGMSGKVQEISKNKARFQVGSMTMTVPLNELRKSDAAHLSTPIKRSGEWIDRAFTLRAATASTRLNIIGMTVAEAIPVVDKFLSDAIVAHISRVTIVHGMGTFALRNGIREHLKHLRIVKDFQEAGENEGAMGATVVNLR